MLVLLARYFEKNNASVVELIRVLRSTVLISEGDGNLFGTTNYQLPNPHIDLPLTLKPLTVLFIEW